VKIFREGVAKDLHRTVLQHLEFDFIELEGDLITRRP